MEYVPIPICLLSANANAIRLYFWLLLNGNYEGSLANLAALLKVTPQQLRTAIAFLQQQQTINKRATNKQQTNIFIINELEGGSNKRATNEQQTSNKRKEKIPTPIPPLNKEIDIIPKEKNNSLKESKKRKGVTTIDGTEEAWERWKEYRRQVGKPYKSELAEQAAYTKALNQAHQSAAEFVKVINQSIENNWQGTFPLREIQKDPVGVVWHKTGKKIKGW